MNLIEQYDLVMKATHEISNIIEELEVKTGGKVDGFSIDDVDVTTMQDNEPKYVSCPRLHYTPPAETMQRLKDSGVFDDKKPWYERMF